MNEEIIKKLETLKEMITLTPSQFELIEALVGIAYTGGQLDATHKLQEKFEQTFGTKLQV